MNDCTERPITYYSRLLAPAEKNYSQFSHHLCCKTFSIVQLYGRKFQILTDHTPLSGMFAQSKVIPNMASSRMLRWCLSQSAYNYGLEFRLGIFNGDVVGLSRLPLGDFSDGVVCVPNHMNDTTATVVDIRKRTHQCPTLSSVLHCVKTT